MILSRLGMKGYPGNISGEKVIFADVVEEEPTAGENPFAKMAGMGGMSDLLGGMDLNNLQNMSQEELMGQIGNIMQNMTPEQQEGMMDMYQNMSDEEKENIMDKGKDMGLF
mgnify:CR=1 FL=1